MVGEGLWQRKSRRDCYKKTFARLVENEKNGKKYSIAGGVWPEETVTGMWGGGQPAQGEPPLPDLKG